MKFSIALFTFSATACCALQAATYSIIASSTEAWKNLDGLTPLTRGDNQTDGDGAVIQIGYFLGVSTSKDTAIFSASDWASFTPITGLGSPNASSFDTTIGDNVSNPGNNAPEGMYSLGILYDDAVNNGFPASIPPEIRLGVRVFDTTDGPTGNYNIVTRFNSAWVLTKPHDDLDPAADPQLIINSSTSADLTWQDANNAFKTTLVPEPSSFALLGLGGIALLFRRRK